MKHKNRKKKDIKVYREAITELVGKIHSESKLRKIYKLVVYLYTRD